jgi:hypothetical protein
LGRENLRVATCKLLGNAWHQGVVARLINLHSKVLKYLGIGLDLALAEGILEELAGFPLFLCLLLKHILKQIGIPLHQPLSIFKSMLQLLLPITLYAFEQGC